MTNHSFAYSLPDTLPHGPLHSRSRLTHSPIRSPPPNFLGRSTFASEPREEKIASMKSLAGVLDRFSKGLQVRKILPSLLEAVGRSFVLEHSQGLILLQMKDPQLLPSILPNVLAISASLSPSEFASKVLRSLKPLFSINEHRGI